MARTAVTKTTLIGPSFSTIATDALDVTWTASDTTNFNSVAFGNSGRMLILFRNTSTTTAYTVTINSFADASLFFRTKDITTYSLGAGEVAHFVVVRLGWEQADNTLYLAGSNAAIEFAAADI